jgi:hypothetical protein
MSSVPENQVFQIDFTTLKLSVTLPEEDDDDSELDGENEFAFTKVNIWFFFDLLLIRC